MATGPMSYVQLRREAKILRNNWTPGLLWNVYRRLFCWPWPTPCTKLNRQFVRSFLNREVLSSKSKPGKYTRI